MSAAKKPGVRKQTPAFAPIPQAADILGVPSSLLEDMADRCELHGILQDGQFFVDLEKGKRDLQRLAEQSVYRWL